MPIQGFVRMRKHQFGRQQSFGTPVAATRAYPFKGTPAPNLNWTDPDIDVGSIDVVAAPYRVAPTLPASLTDPSLCYNNIPLLLSAIFGGAEAPSAVGGSGWSWTHEPASTTVDPIDVFSYEFFDDVVTDAYQFGDGVLSSVEFSGPDGLGPISTSMTWMFGSVASSGATDMPDNPVVPTGGLDVSTTDAIVYLKDMGIYIASTTAGLAAGQVTDALHSFTLTINQAWDEKRFANADQSFDADAYGRGARSIELECTFAKTADTVGIGSESDAWMSDDAVNRYVELKFTSKVMADGATPYSWDVIMPMRYYTRTEGAIGGNTTVVLTGHAFYDPDDLDGVFTSTAVTTLSEAELGLAGS